MRMKGELNIVTKSFVTEEDMILKEAGIQVTPAVIGIKRRIEEFNADVRRTLSRPPIFYDFDKLAKLKRQREQLEIIVTMKLGKDLASKLILPVERDRRKKIILSRELLS